MWRDKHTATITPILISDAGRWGRSGTGSSRAPGTVVSPLRPNDHDVTLGAPFAGHNNIDQTCAGQSMKHPWVYLLYLLVFLCAAWFGIGWNSAARAEPVCNSVDRLTIRVSVLSSRPPVRTDFSAADLQAMASKATIQPRHRPLGFYKDTLGYRLAVSRRSEPRSACPAMAVHVQLVEGERVIEIARDLRTTPCLFAAALNHYRRHAAAASAALNSLAVSLPARLRAEIEHGLPTYPERGATLQQRIETRLNAVLDAEIATYTGEFRVMQNNVDTPAEIARLESGCGNV